MTAYFSSFARLGCISVFFLAALIELATIPRILLISKRKRLFDTPDYRKLHKKPIPRLAGITFLPVIILSLLPLLSALAILFPEQALYFGASFFISASFFICGAIILMMIGFKDDLVGVRYSHKFVAQIFAALCIIASGNRINDFYGLLGIHSINLWIGIPVTIMLAVLIINAINLIDGIDGLASTLVSITAFVLGCIFIAGNSYTYAFLAFSVVGVQLPFLRYNFSSQRKIFMGDTGSLTLGYIISFLSIHLCMLPPENSFFDGALPAIIASSLLFVPLFDVVRVFSNRLVQKKPPFSPDKNHIHHKLVRLGYSHQQICLILGGITLTHLILNISLYPAININIIFFINLFLASGGIIYLNLRLKNKYK